MPRHDRNFTWPIIGACRCISLQVRRSTNQSSSSLDTDEFIGVLQNILARSRVIIPDLETPYSRFPNIDHSAIDREDLSISAIVTERQQQLDAVLHEISGLETIMDSVKNLHQQLVEKREKIMQSMNLHKGLVSTLWRLPTEVLAQIFHHCFPEFRHWQRTRLSSDPTRNVPMLLTRICRRWRNVVTDTPSLWCRLYLIMHKNWEQTAFCYNSWLERSRGIPLSLALLCYKNEETKLRGVIQPYISQISSLYIEFFHGANPELMLQDIPALQELTITSRCNDMPTMSQSAFRLPSTLRSFKLVGLDLTLQRLSSLSTIFAQLTSVEIVINDHPHALLHLLQLSPNLSSLTFTLGFGLFTRILQPFTHARLRSLRIIRTYENTLPRLFNTLSLPNLRVLEAHRVETWPHEELKALLARSNYPLESLILGDDVTIDEERAEYIALMPSLEVVVGPTYDDYFDGWF